MNMKSFSTFRLSSLMILIGMAFSASPGCAPTMAKPGAKIMMVDAKMVQDCKFLGDVNSCDQEEDPPLWVPNGESNGFEVENARYKALQEAAALGATHILWTGIRKGDRICAGARVYKCE